MNKEELEAALVELDTALVKAFPNAEPMRCLVVGGACLVLAEISARPTKDIDTIIIDFLGRGSDTLVYGDEADKKKVRQIIRKLGRQFGLPKNELLWFNDDCSSFLVEVSDIPAMRLVREYQKLLLYIPDDMGFILACKFMAGRPAKDFADIKILCDLIGIHTRAQAQQLVDRFVPSLYHQHLHDVRKTLKILFPEE